MINKYTLNEIASIVDGKLLGKVPSNPILYLVLDSRKIIFPNSSLFIAIKGPHHDGHQYIPNVVSQGIAGVLVSENDAFKYQSQESTFIVVKDTLAALQKLAAFHRNSFTHPVVGITGSNGKTIVKDWLSSVLSTEFNICKNPKSYNSQVGVPLSLWNLNSDHEIGIFEAGISQPGEMEKLESMIRPVLGIFTNIGSAHEENFMNLDEKIQEKLKLFAHADKLIIRNDDPNITNQAKKIYPDKKLITWGNSGDNSYQVSFVKEHGNCMVYITDGTENYTYSIPFTDSASIENSMHVFIAGLTLGIPSATLSAQMKLLPRVNMRLSFKAGKNNCFIIDDTYSNDFDSLKIAIDSLAGLHQFPQKTIILSDIIQSKTDKLQLYQSVAELIHQKGIQRIIGVGNEISHYKQLFQGNVRMFQHVNECLQHVHELQLHNEAILIKGARIFELEKLVSRLENKVHDTILEVNLNAMVHNLNYFRKHLPIGPKLMAMVKASGYGTGTHEIAHILHFHHIDYLAVAYADEGIELRNHGIDLPIMVMNAESTNIETLIEHRLEPVVYNFEILHTYQEHLKSNKAKLEVHLEIDTGMHRLGFNLQSIDELCQQLKAEPGIKVNSIFSHLAGADEPELDPFTYEQIKQFDIYSKQIELNLGYKVLRHIANSAGAGRFKDAAFDMVRLGIGLYGVGSSQEEQAKLQPVISLYSTIAQITEVKPGDSVGYGRSFIASSPMKIATVPIGYADGYRRSLGNGQGKMFIHGKAAPVVGRVCMDMTMINISGMDVEVGDRVEIIGENLPIELFAKLIDTIPYEVLTSISQRVKRIYTQE